jgi:hypothetical protein
LTIEETPGRNTLNCKICGKETSENDFCELHLKAYKNIIVAFDIWKKALSLSWKEYLSQIAKNSLTGTWAIEVANYLIQNGETQNVRQS